MNPKQIQLSAGPGEENNRRPGRCSKSIVKTFLIPLMLLLTIAAAFARLGETPDQCSLRYGSSVGQNGPFFIYSKDHVKIAVLFRDGLSAKEIFAPESGASFSKEQIAELLNANSGGATWSLVSAVSAVYKEYDRSDGRALATFDGALTIWDCATRIVPGKQPTSGF